MVSRETILETRLVGLEQAVDKAHEKFADLLNQAHNLALALTIVNELGPAGLTHTTFVETAINNFRDWLKERGLEK